MGAGALLHTATLGGHLGQGQPEIVTTDQEIQFTSAAYTSRLKADGIQIS